MSTHAPIVPEEGSTKKILVVPGGVSRGKGFTIQYVTESGTAEPLCVVPRAGAAFTTLRSPSGTGKTTLLECFVRHLRDRGESKSGQLSFIASEGINAPPTFSIGTVPQNLHFVKHWALRRLLPADTWAAPAAFGAAWEGLKTRLMGQTSGGQQRRVYACSVLERLHRTSGTAVILVLDETLDGLSTKGAGGFVDGAAQAWRTHDQRVLYLLLVTHLPEVEASVPEAVRASLEVVSDSSTNLRVRFSGRS
jgi:ABC-type Mn2+/Zn2+ transport system ATPase subunit